MGRLIRRFAALLPGALWLALASPAPAHAFPVSAVVSFFAAIGITISGTVAAVATFLVNTAISIGLNAVATKLMGPKSQNDGQARQASVLSLTLGEGPRQAIFGKAATGGLLLDAFDWGGDDRTDWEVLVIKVADHKCAGLDGFIISDTFYPFAADGVQAGFGGQLEVYWMDGDPAQVAHPYLLTNSPNRLYGSSDWEWTADDVCASQAVVIVAYKADDPKSDNPVWPSGRPNFKFVVKGKLCYDPRKDATVAGGSGTHRWTDPTTWEWTENARVCDYNYDRGIYALDQVDDPNQLLIGRGLSDLEAPPDRVAAVANICDEAVTLKAGGTEPRYRVGCVVKADETFISIKQKFADAMGGEIVKRNGGVEVLPGVAQSTVAEITDDDLVVGEAVSWKPFLTDGERINTVIGQYVAPDQLWNTATAPIRTSTADVTADGGQKNDTPSLDFVTSQTQAQRICEIRRRLARMEKRIAPVLPPPFAHLEDGDWIGWTSARYFGGARVVFRADAYSVAANWRNSLVLREIDSTAFDWVAATDEGVPGQAPVDEFGSVTALELAGVDIFAFELTGDGGQALPAVKATWTTPVPKACDGVRLEVRKVGTVDATVTTTHSPNDGQLVTQDGIVADTAMEARLVPLTMDGRKVTPTAWAPVATGSASGSGVDIPSANLWRLADYEASGGASEITPLFGVSDWGFRFVDTALGTVQVSAHTQALAPAGRYSFAFRAQVTAGAGSAKIRCGWRAAGGAAIADVPDQEFTITATEERFAWQNIQSSDPAFTTATFQIFDQAGDLAAGQHVDIGDLIMVVGNTAPLGFSPCPDDPQALALMGAGPLATSGLDEAQVANSLAPIGSNAVVNSEFLAGAYPPTGWAAGLNSTGLTLTGSIVTGIGKAAKGVIAGTPAAGTQFDAIDQDVSAFQKFTTPVLPGDTVCGSARVAYQNCDGVQIFLVFFDGSGNLLSALSGGAPAGAHVSGDTVDPAAYGLISVVTTAPANARWAQLVPARAHCNGAGVNPAVWCMQPLVARLPAGQTVVPPYQPGPALRDADQTASNTAAAITGQGALATRNYSYFGSSLLTEDSGGATPATLSNFKTPLGTAAAFAGQGSLATRNFAYFGSSFLSEDSGGGTPATLTNFKTVLGTAAAITGQGAWATYSTVSPATMSGRTQYFDSDGRAYGYQAFLMPYSVGGAVGRATQPLSSTSSTVSVAAHSVLVANFSGGNATLSIPSTSFSGQPSDTTMTVFYIPGVGTWSCQGPGTTENFRPGRDGWMEIGAIRTATTGGTYNPPPYGGGGVVAYCVDVDAWLSPTLRAGDATVGDPLTMMNPSGDEVYEGKINAIALSEARRLRFRTARGAELVVSDTAPIMTREGPRGMPYATSAADCRPGMVVPLHLAGAVVWDEVAAIEDEGLGPVARISAFDGIFAASQTPDGTPIFTHNNYNKP